MNSKRRRNQILYKRRVEWNFLYAQIWVTDLSKKEGKGAENISIEDMRVLFTRITSEMFIISFRFYAFGGWGCEGG